MAVRYRRPADRRSKPKRWQDAVETLADLLDDYQAWRDSLPASLAEAPSRIGWMSCWSCASWSTSSPRPSCPRASGGTEATMRKLLWLAAGGIPLAFVVGYLIGRFLL